MTTTFQFTVTPDASLNTAPMIFTATLSDPGDFQALVASQQSLLSLPSNSAPVEVIGAWLGEFMTGTVTNVGRWVLAQKVDALTLTVPTITIIGSNT